MFVPTNNGVMTVRYKVNNITGPHAVCAGLPPGSSQMVDKDTHTHYSKSECQGDIVHVDPVTIGNCSKSGTIICLVYEQGNIDIVLL